MVDIYLDIEATAGDFGSDNGCAVAVHASHVVGLADGGILKAEYFLIVATGTIVQNARVCRLIMIEG